MAWRSNYMVFSKYPQTPLHPPEVCFALPLPEKAGRGIHFFRVFEGVLRLQKP
jgi:hypothetical protein